MEEDQITEAQVEAILEGIHETFEQQDTIRYHGIVGSVAVGVVIKRRTFPPRVVTTFRLWTIA